MKAVSVIDTKVDLLFKGSISVRDLKYAHEYQEVFAEAAVLVKPRKQGSIIVTKDMIYKGINVRLKELIAFQSTAKLLISLTILCKSLPNGKTTSKATIPLRVV